MTSTEYAKFYCGYKNIDSLPGYCISFNRVLQFSVSAFIIQECILQRAYYTERGYFSSVNLDRTPDWCRWNSTFGLFLCLSWGYMCYNPVSGWIIVSLTTVIRRARQLSNCLFSGHENNRHLSYGVRGGYFQACFQNICFNLSTRLKYLFCFLSFFFSSPPTIRALSFKNLDTLHDRKIIFDFLICYIESIAIF